MCATILFCIGFGIWLLTIVLIIRTFMQKKRARRRDCFWWYDTMLHGLIIDPQYDDKIFIIFLCGFSAGLLSLAAAVLVAMA